MPSYVHRGSVDTRFLGIMIRAQSLAELAAFRSMDWAAGLPADQLREIGIDAFVNELGRRTLLDHEVRHFHDTLLYPFGPAVLREQMSLVVNGFGLFVRGAHEPANANVLPVPLQEWLLLPADGRARWLAQQSGAPAGQPIPPDLPVIDPDDDLEDLPRGILDLADAEMIAAACRVSVKAQRNLEALWMGPQVPDEPKLATTVAFWEVPGTLCQLAAIHRLADAACMQRFADWFLEHGPRRYRMGFQLTESLISSPPGTGRMREWLALAAWLQMGRYKDGTDAWTSSPLFRIYQLHEARNRGLRWRGDESFLDLVSLWDEAIGRSSLDDLHDSTRELSQLADRSAHRANLSGGELAVSRTAAGLQAYYQAHLAMKELFLRDPDMFVDPAAYLDHQPDYPRPVVKVWYRERMEDGHWSYDDIDATPPGWRPAIDISTAEDLGTLVEATSAVFLPSDQTLEPAAEALIRMFLHMEPLRKFRSEKRPIDREGIFKQLLKGRVSRGYDLLDQKQYQEIAELWQPLAGNPLFSVNNPAWGGLKCYQAQILQGKCQLFIARSQLRGRDDLRKLTQSAFSALSELAQAEPIPITEGTDNNLPPQEAVAVNRDYRTTLEFAGNWLDEWGPDALVAFTHVPVDSVMNVILLVRARLVQLTDMLRAHDG